MFERNRVDNAAAQQRTTVPVEIIRDDGLTEKGKFVLPAGKPVFEILNGDAAFIEFEPYGGVRCLIAKAAIRQVRLTSVPVAADLNNKLKELDPFDPYKVLGVPSDAPFEDVRAAFHRLAKEYHPDRYASAELPREVRDYLAAMVRRINAAYAALEGSHQSARRSAVARAEPVYTSRPRA